MKRKNLVRTGSALALLTLFGAGSASADTSHQFTIGVIPDTQNYCDSVTPGTSPQPASAGIYQQEMQYLADQKAAQNIVFVTHVGDVVQHGDLYDQEWINASNAMNILGASGIPFGMVPGNHDYDNYSHSSGNRPLVGSAKWNAYFGTSSVFFAGKSWFGGTFTDPYSGGVSSYQTFSAGGKTFLHISLEMEASDSTLAWATGVIKSHASLPTIVTTHEYLSYQNDGNGIAMRLQDGYMNGESCNQAQAVWDKFLSQNDQIFLVLCGHNWSSTDSHGISDGENLRIDNNVFGHPVYQVLSDYQGNTFDASGKAGVYAGGAGWLRLMTFDTQTGTIHFRTYSTELQQYAGVAGGPTFSLPATLSDFTLPIPARVFAPAPWKFGVLSDTQWVTSDDGKSPESIPASIIQQVDKEFIAKGVKVVIAVGDTVDTSTADTQDTRALYSQDLYNAGIGFYPLRGNHDSELAASGVNFATLYPQIVNGGFNNLTPSWDTTSFIESLGGTFSSYNTLVSDFSTGVPPAPVMGAPFQVGSNFCYPTANGPLTGVTTAVNPYPGVTTGNGLSYSFDLSNVRFMLLDQFEDSSLGGNVSSISAQQPWISQQLSDSGRPYHALVFSHKNLLGGNHKDNLLGANATGDPGDGAFNTNGLTGSTYSSLASKMQAEDAFISSLNTNGVHYLITGHDHHHADSVVRSPLNSKSAIRQLIAQSDSNKFYTPATPFSTNEISISEDLYEVGYYIGTVDGPRINIDYYAVPTYAGGANVGTTPVLTGNWAKMLSFGYSLNGKEFLVPQGGSYTCVNDGTTAAIANAAAFNEGGYVGASLSILNGTNGSTLKTKDGRKLTKAIDTGWAPANGTISDIASLWGLVDLSAGQSDTIVVAITFNPTGLDLNALQTGGICLGTRDLKTGVWINAVDANIVGGAKNFVNGAYSTSYGLGTYGAYIDSVSGLGVAWAVVNGNNRDFAVITTPTAALPWDLDGNGVVNTADLNLLSAAIRAHSTSSIYDLNNDGKVDTTDTRWLTQHYTNVGGK